MLHTGKTIALIGVSDPQITWGFRGRNLTENTESREAIVLEVWGVFQRLKFANFIPVLCF